MSGQVIPIRADNGWPECLECEHADSGVCEFCEEADHFEPAGMLEAA